MQDAVMKIRFLYKEHLVALLFFLIKVFSTNWS